MRKAFFWALPCLCVFSISSVLFAKTGSAPDNVSRPGESRKVSPVKAHDNGKEVQLTPGEVIKKVISSFNKSEIESLQSLFPNLIGISNIPDRPLGPPPPIVVDEKLVRILDPMVEKLISAYHAKNAKTFYDLFAPSVSALSDPKIFRKNYLTPAFGKCLKRKLAPEKCSFFPPAPLIQYDAEFEKAQKVTISVNFIKEGSGYKVLQVQFEKMP